MTRLWSFEEPLPKPSVDPIGYASVRTLEALVETLIALELLEKGYTRSAAGKIYLAWRALLASLLSLEESRVRELLKPSEEARVRKHVLYASPTTLLKIASILESLGYEHLRAYTHLALNLRDYQHHGSDPDMEMSKYCDRVEAAEDIRRLAKTVIRLVKDEVEPRLRGLNRWDEELNKALKLVEEKLSRA